jgi:TPR repeat protein
MSFRTLVLLAAGLSGAFAARPAAAQLAEDPRTPEAAVPWDVRPQDAVRTDDFTPESLGLLESCRADATDACLALARRFHGGHEVPRDGELAVRLFDWACDAGEAMACVELGGRYYMGFDVPADLGRALDLLERACAGDAADACLVAGRMRRDGVGSERDREAASALFERGCALGLPTACDERGRTAQPGRNEALLPDLAPTVLREAARSCDSGAMVPCHRLALAYREGDGVAPDTARADALDDEACDWGLLAACEALGR